MLTLRKLAIKDPESSDLVILSNIMDGVDGSTAFGFSVEEQSVSIDDMQKLDYREDTQMDLKVIRPSASDLAKIDSLKNKPVEISGYTLEGFVQFLGTHILTRIADYNSDIINDQLRVYVQSPFGYFDTDKGRARQFYAGKNALSLYNILAGTNDILNGFEADSSVSTILASGGMDVSTDAVGTGVKSHDVFFPFEGVKVFSSAEFNDANMRFRIGIRFLDENKSILEEEFKDFIADGRRTVSAVVPENTYYIKLFAEKHDNDGTSGKFNIKEPMIAVREQEFST